MTNEILPDQLLGRLESVRGWSPRVISKLETLIRNISDKLVPKISIHTGHSIVVTLNDRLDYFGQTVNIASHIQGWPTPGKFTSAKMCITSPAYGNLWPVMTPHPSRLQ